MGLGFGSAKIGNFLAVDGTRSGRFLDTPEFTPFHDIGNNETIFDHFDFEPNGKDSFHLNLFAARNWIQIPNDYDQLSQDQHQRVPTWSVAPGYQHTFNAHTLLTINPYIRKDEFFYYGSRDPFADTPVHPESKPPVAELGREERPLPDRRPPQFENRNRRQADAAAGEFRLRHHRPDLQPHLRRRRAAIPPARRAC